MADPQDDARTTQEILEQVARTLNIRSYDLAPPEVMAKFEAAYHEHCALPTPDGIHNHKLSLASIASALGDLGDAVITAGISHRPTLAEHRTVQATALVLAARALSMATDAQSDIVKNWGNSAEPDF